MKIVTESFGRAILVILSFTLVTALIFAGLSYNGKVGLPAILGAAAEETTKDLDAEQTMTAQEAAMEVKRQAVPRIVGKGSVKTDLPYDVTTMFEDSEGNAFASVRILSIGKIKDDGEVLDVTNEVLDADRANITFPTTYENIVNETTGRNESGKGAYQIRLTCVANDGTQQTSSLCVGVIRSRKGA